jgi:solute carrier family 25 citrate transporter 1
MPPNKKKHPALQLIAGGTAGLVESSICHPLDTIKTRMQLRRQQSTIEAVRARSSLSEPGMARNMSSMSSLAEPRLTPLHSMKEPAGIRAAASSLMGRAGLAPRVTTRGPVVQASMGPIGTARRIIEREGFLSLYKGLSAVYSGIIPKMAIRFLSFEQYREALQRVAGPPPPGAEYSVAVNFSAGLASGLTEAVMIVTPAEVCKIRMQSQYNSLMDPSQLSRRKYTNVVQTALTIVKEEGVGALYKGIVPTMMRQGCNQAVNFTTYNIFKRKLLEIQDKKELQHWQSLVLGGVSGGFGPMVNNPLDVVKTRLQKQVIKPGRKPKYTGIVQAIRLISNEEGYMALWKGITPRLMRIMPGQAITFMTYEAVSTAFISRGYFA